jgi:hypothetical protein
MVIAGGEVMVVVEPEVDTVAQMIVGTARLGQTQGELR